MIDLILFRLSMPIKHLVQLKGNILSLHLKTQRSIAVKREHLNIIFSWTFWLLFILCVDQGSYLFPALQVLPLDLEVQLLSLPTIILENWFNLYFKSIYEFKFFSRGKEIQGWCPAGSVLRHGKVSLQLCLATLFVMLTQRKYLRGRCFITSTSLAPHLFILG